MRTHLLLFTERKAAHLCRSTGYDNLEYYLDNGESGLDFKRPAFFHLELISGWQIGKVIASDISRIGRNSFG
jgi:hypothetical protein